MLTLPSKETEYVVFGDSNFFFLNIKVHLRQRGQKGKQVSEKGTVHVSGNLLLEFFLSLPRKKIAHSLEYCFCLRCSWLLMITV